MEYTRDGRTFHVRLDDGLKNRRRKVIAISGGSAAEATVRRIVFVRRSDSVWSDDRAGVHLSSTLSVQVSFMASLG